MYVSHLSGGRHAPPLSPPAAEELDLLKQMVLFSADDERALGRVWKVLAGRSDDYLDVLLGLTAAHPRLQRALTGLDGDLPAARLETARAGFRRWLATTCARPYDPSWVARLYAAVGADEAGGWGGAAPGFRYLNLLVYPLTATVRPFLAGGGHDGGDIERMHQAWMKSMILQATLLGRGYVPEERW